MIRRRAIGLLCALCLLAACGGGAAPAPVPTISQADRAAAQARQTEVVAKVTATAESRAATATAVAVPTATATATPPRPTQTPRPTPTPRPPTPTPPRAAAALFDFAMVAYQGGESLGGDQVRFSSAFAAELPVVVNFWAPLCGPCRTELPAFQRVADEFAGRVTFIGVDISPYWPGFGDRNDAFALIRESRVRYPLTYAVESPLEAYKLLNLPSTYLFAPDGTVSARFTGTVTEAQLRTAVTKLAGGAAGGGEAASVPVRNGDLAERREYTLTMDAWAMRGPGRPGLTAVLAVVLAWVAAVAATAWFPAAGGLAGGVERAAGGAADSLGRLAELLRVSYAFSVGMVAGVNPCGFALLPTYLALFAGSASGAPLPLGRQVARACGVGALVTLGFVVLFGLVGLALTLVSVAIAGALAWAGLIVGTLLVAGGGLLLGGGSLPMLIANVPVVGRLASRLGSVARRSGALGYFAYGLAYGLASLGCALPLFLGVVGTALTSGGALQALRQYLLYALGMGAVITALTLLAAVAGQGVLRAVRGSGRWVGMISAVLLVLAGSYVIHYWLVNGTIFAGLRR